MEREAVIEELKRVANLLGQQTVSRRHFARHGHFSPSAVERCFGSWSQALRSAGLGVTTTNLPLSDGELEAEFQRVRQELGKAPTRSEFAAHSRHSPTVYERRFGGWRTAVAHYLGPQGADTSASHLERGASPVAGESIPRHRTTRPGVEVSKGKRVFGAPLNFRGLRNEPIDEQGVVFLFGMVAHELGFLVESVRTPFPDCRAKRREKRGYYVEVDIEIEFKSGNFREHGHPPDECDLVVCWEHDWPECPVEVLELKSAIRELAPNV